jgi:DNA processing protein
VARSLRPAQEPEEAEEASDDAPENGVEPPAPVGDETAHARLILETLLSPTPVSVDEVLRRCPCSGAAVNAALLELDLEGRLERLPGNRVALRGP